jgi:hypothetical protein
MICPSITWDDLSFYHVRWSVLSREMICPSITWDDLYVTMYLGKWFDFKLFALICRTNSLMNEIKQMVLKKIPEQMSSPQDSGANEFTPVFRSKWVHPNIPEQMSSPQEFCCTRVAQYLLFNVVFCKSLFVLLAITLPVFWPLLCLSFGHYFACLLTIT